jgi:hypothetical protein
MKYLILKTHAKRSGFGLYRAGETYPASEVEEPAHKLKVGLIQVLIEPKKIEVKEEKANFVTKEEKTTKRRGRKRKN